MKRNFVFMIFVWSQIVLVSLMAQGNISVSPKRIVLTEETSRGEILLINSGKDTVSYTISFVQFSMSESGRLEKLENGENEMTYASPFVNIFPREVTLAPSEQQIIMVNLKRNLSLSDGEYRSHIHFNIRKDKRGGSLADKVDQKSRTSIVPAIGITLPVIIRIGDLSAAAELKNIRINPHDKANVLNLSFDIFRTGNSSLYGDLEVGYKNTNAIVTNLGTIKGVAVYTNISRRVFNLILKMPPEVNVRTDKLIVRYLQSPNMELKYDEAEIEMSGLNSVTSSGDVACH